VAKLSAALTLLLVVCIETNGFTAPMPGLSSPGAAGAPAPAEAEVTYGDPLGRSTPQGTAIGFMKAASQTDYQQALRYLDTRATGVAAQKLVVGLRTILDRGFAGRLTRGECT
jgi:MscS family membrane protein